MLRRKWLLLLTTTALLLPLASILIVKKSWKIPEFASDEWIANTEEKIINVANNLPVASDNSVMDDKLKNVMGELIAQNRLAMQKEYRTALVIGNSKYKLATELANPTNDATDIANSLRKLGFEVTLLKDADLRQMEQAIDNFNRNLRQGGTGLFYYAGHGTQVDGENYLIPIDARLEREQDVRYESLPVGKLLNVMEDASNDVNIIILDACRNNPFGRKWRSFQRGLAPPTQTVKGTLIAYATSPGKTALDGEGRNSPYTTALLQHLKTPNLDVEQMFKQVRGDVLKQTGGKQTPWESSSLVGSFVFNAVGSNNVATSVGKSSPLPTSTIPTTTPSASPITSLVITPSPTLSPTTGTRTAYFTQPPSLLKASTTYNRVSEPNAVYYFTINLPENAGEPLQKITIQQREGLEYIRFQLDKSVAFEGTESQEGQKLELKDISSDQKTQTVSIAFNPPVSPGKKITIGLKARQNPQFDGVYLFGVTAFPQGEKSHSQFLGFGRLHFYRRN
ncbi:peptidase C14 caspase catalytic subunit p20 [Nostoc carneum NIES-2107]|nr:peptidase C14 caspase catalytic subunit p20 [Nostoc carneum NIES-2107]